MPHSEAPGFQSTVLLSCGLTERGRRARCAASRRAPLVSSCPEVGICRAKSVLFGVHQQRSTEPSCLPLNAVAALSICSGHRVEGFQSLSNLSLIAPAEPASARLAQVSAVADRTKQTMQALMELRPIPVSELETRQPFRQTMVENG